MKGIKGLVLIGLIWVLVSVGCITPQSGDYYLEDPFGGNFTYSGEPKLGEEFEVVFYMKPLTTFDNATIGVKISDGLELVEGDTSYVGSLKGPERVNNRTKWNRKELRMKLKAVKEGTHQIEVTAKGRFKGRSGSVDELWNYWLFITSSKNLGEFSRHPPRGLLSQPQTSQLLQKSVEGE